MGTNREAEIDHTVESTMDASDPPQFTDSQAEMSNVERQLARLEKTRDENLTQDQEQNLTNVLALVEDYKKGKVLESQVLEAMERVIDQIERTHLH